MGQFCDHCGVIRKPGNRFCENCGAPYIDSAPPAAETANVSGVYRSSVGHATVTYAAPPKPPARKKTGLIIGIVAVAVAIIAAVIAVVLLLPKDQHEEPIELVRKLLDGDFDVVEDMAPEEYWEFAEAQYGVELNDAAFSRWETLYDRAMDALESYYGRNVEIGIEITDSSELSQRKVEKLGETLEDIYDINDTDVTQAYELELEITVEGKNDDYSFDYEVLSVKIDGKWYLVDNNDMRNFTVVTMERILYQLAQGILPNMG